MTDLTRRGFLAGTAGAALAASFSPTAASEARRIVVSTRQIEVVGRAATVYSLAQPDGTPGLVSEAGREFAVTLENALAEPTLVHWHGLTPPWLLDGVPGLTQQPLAEGGSHDYRFMNDRAGTHWMHSHLGLQEQGMLAAPLILRDPAEAGLDEQEVVVMLHDFSFRPAGEILESLKGGGHGMGMGATAGGHGMSGMSGGAMTHGGMSGMSGGAMTHGGMSGMPMADLNDIEHDAYLANDRTLDDPETVAVEPGGRVRLRIINGAASTNFTIDLGGAEGELIAVDGNPVRPVRGSRFPAGIAQRLDIRLTMPRAEALAVLALREGGPQRTGILLRPRGAPVRRIAAEGAEAGPVLDLGFEGGLAARSPLAARPADRRVAVDLTGTMQGYAWGMAVDGVAEAPVSVRRGERVELVLRNPTMMSHPMHLHGHHFQVVGLGRHRLAGAMRDTVLVPPMQEVTVAFDAVNPGKWAFHCHHMYHMAAGMMTSLRYEGVA